jgi:predicted dehydrogenase
VAFADDDALLKFPQKSAGEQAKTIWYYRAKEPQIAKEMLMSREIGIGLAGYGAIGRVHALCWRMLPLVYPDLPLMPRIVAVSAASERSRERAQRELGPVELCQDGNQLVALDSVELIDCCTPTALHADLVLATLNAKKALFCEKPLAATLDQAQAIADLAQAQNLDAGLNFHFRFIPALQEAKRRIDAGLLGEVQSFHLRYYRASNLRTDRGITWRFTGAGSGVLVDLGSHLIDLVEHLLGPIAKVSAHLHTAIPERTGPDGQPAAVESDDVAWLSLALANGARGTLEASKVVPGAADDLRIEAYGSDGSLIFDTREPSMLYLAEGRHSPIGGQTIATFSRTLPNASIPGAETPTGWLQWHMASFAAYLHALAGQQTPQPGIAAGLAVDRVIATAQRSAQQQGILLPVGE